MGPTPVKKHGFILLEILVTLFLSSMLLLVCMKSLTGIYLCKNKVAKAAKRIEAITLMDKTLFCIFANTKVNSLVLSKDKNSMNFSYYNIIDPDLDYAGLVNAQLIATENKGALIEISNPKNKKKKRILHLNRDIKKFVFDLDKHKVLKLQAYDTSNRTRDFAYFFENKEEKAHA